MNGTQHRQEFRATSFEYHQGSSEFDCSVDSAFSLYFPDDELAGILKLAWSNQAANFKDSMGQLVTTDPSAFESGLTALLLRRNSLEEMSKTKQLSMCWIMLGEKLAYLPGPSKRTGEMLVSGACALRDGRIEGFVHFIRDTRDDEHQELGEAIIATKRF